MKLSSLVFFLLVIGFIHLACSTEEEERAAMQYPSLTSATQVSETVQSRIDPAAQKTEQLAKGVQTAAGDASNFGIPGASTIALIAGVIGTIAGAYNERRRGTLPVKSALTQVVQSIESAFPAKTDSQKSALAAMQDQTTKQLVAQIKGA